MVRRLCKLLLPLLPLAVQADVFMRTARTAETLMRELGGAKVYETDVSINGRNGRLTSFVFEETSDVVGARLARRLKLPLPGNDSAIMLDASGKTLVRYFVLRAPNLRNSALVTALEQSAASVGKSRPESIPWPSGIPVFNALPSFTAVCAKTRTTFLSAVSSSGTAESAVDQAVTALRGAGWQECVPSTPRFRILVQGRSQCVVFADAKQESGDITINLLQRDGARQ